MADKEIKKLSRTELLEIIKELEGELEHRKTENEDTGTPRDDEKIKENIQRVDEERRRMEKTQKTVRRIRNTIAILIVVAAIAVLIATQFLPVLQVSGTSMSPTLESGQILVLVKTDSPKQGDLVGFYYQSKVLLKRVIAEEGDYVTIDEDGNVFINGEQLDEPYLTEKSLGECDIEFPYQVPEGCIFVMGDHRATSIDSRSSSVGCVSTEQLVGKVVLRIWPLKDIGMMGS